MQEWTHDLKSLKKNIHRVCFQLLCVINQMISIVNLCVFVQCAFFGVRAKSHFGWVGFFFAHITKNAAAIALERLRLVLGEREKKDVSPSWFGMFFSLFFPPVFLSLFPLHACRDRGSSARLHLSVGGNIFFSNP